MRHQTEIHNGWRKTGRRANALLWVVVVGSFLVPSLSSDEPTPESAKKELPADARVIRIEVFVREDSERSSRVVELLKAIEQKRTGVDVVTREVINDQPSRERFWKLAKHYQVAKPVVPAVYVMNRFHVGFRDAKTTQEQVDAALAMHVFVREGCPHCRDAKAFLAGLERRWPGLNVQLHDVVQNQDELRWMNQLAEQHRIVAASLPCFYVCGRMRVGYLNDQTTGQELERLLEDSQPPQELAPERPAVPESRSQGSAARSRFRRRRQVANVSLVSFVLESDDKPASPAPAKPSLPVPKESALPIPEESPLPIPDEASGDDVPLPKMDSGSSGLPPLDAPPVTEAPDGISLPLFGRLQVQTVGLPLFTIAVGLVDGFNPCAMWVLILLLSILVNIQDRKKIIVIAGTFVVISGLAYFAFMAAWLNVFRLIGMARPVQIALGSLAMVIGLVNVKDFVAFRRGVSLSIPESAKPGIYARVRGIVQAKYLTAALFGAAVLAILVNVVEILCTAGLPALYTQILTLQELPAWRNYLYLGLYNLAYMFDDSVMLIIAVVTLSHRRLQESEGRWLKLISGSVILALGLVMLMRPEWLS